LQGIYLVIEFTDPVIIPLIITLSGNLNGLIIEVRADPGAAENSVGQFFLPGGPLASIGPVRYAVLHRRIRAVFGPLAVGTGDPASVRNLPGRGGVP
jgi:hypothetical protein